MKLINQSFEIINQTDFSLEGILKHIERCARVSYKSENKITEDSYKRFVDMLVSRQHDRPLEFGTVHLIFKNFANFCNVQRDLVLNDTWNPEWIKYKNVNGVYYVTTNYRYYLKLLKYVPQLKSTFTEEDNENYPIRPTVHMILSRGVMDEFRTHVGLSHLAESTRYCNYSKGKFGGEVTFVKPNWFFETTSQAVIDHPELYPNLVLQKSLENSEQAYLELLNNGCKPQEAREVLPLCVKSELISCGFIEAWDNFFWRRDAKDAHPMAQEIAKPLHQEFIKLGYLTSPFNATKIINYGNRKM